MLCSHKELCRTLLIVAAVIIHINMNLNANYIVGVISNTINSFIRGSSVMII